MAGGEQHCQPELFLPCPSLLKGDYFPPRSLLTQSLQAYDRMHIPITFNNVPISVILSLPLTQMFKVIPVNHFLHRHTEFRAADFFIYDSQVHRLRLKRQEEFLKFPGLFHRLTRHIFDTSEVVVADFTHQWILNDSDFNLSPDTSIVEQIVNHDSYSRFQSKIYRLPINNFSSSFRQYSPRLIRLMYQLPLLPSLKSMWYKYLTGKLPTRLFFFHIQLNPSPCCLICPISPEESPTHFLVNCAPKWIVWQRVLGNHYPYLAFSQNDILQSILLHSVPSLIPEVRMFLTILGCTLWHLWKAHWAHILQQIPFNTDRVISKSLSEISLVHSIMDNSYID
ncbi:hypothetical protein BDB01DRAFT_909972 [Pilobolus umbonatus]|nr:hypothetical protein BDB01DRAFT_909972 [Pilobolus umbonatus]